MEKYSILLILFVIFQSLQLLSSQNEENSSQPVCPASFSCSSLGYLSFPFYTSNDSACGLCEVDCSQVVAKIKLKQEYPFFDLVQFMSGSSDYVVVRDNYFANQINNNSCDSLIMYSFPPNSSSISYYISPTLPVLRCLKSPGLVGQVDDYFKARGEYYGFNSCDDYDYYYTYFNGYISANTNLPPLCSVIVLPGNPPSMLPKETDFNNLFKLLTSELNIVVQVSDRCQECYRKGGRCANENQEFMCEERRSSNIKKGM